MSDPSLYEYPSPLAGFENLAPLPEYVRPLFNTAIRSLLDLRSCLQSVEEIFD